MNRIRPYSALAALIVPAVTVLAVAGATAASASAANGPVVTDVRTAAAFDYAAGQQPENVTINPDGSLTISMLGFLNGQPPELLRISGSGQQTVLVTGQPGEAIGGNARGRDGSIYYNMLSADPARSGIWRLPPGGVPPPTASTRRPTPRSAVRACTSPTAQLPRRTTRNCKRARSTSQPCSAPGPVLPSASGPRLSASRPALVGRNGIERTRNCVRARGR